MSIFFYYFFSFFLFHSITQSFYFFILFLFSFFTFFIPLSWGLKFHCFCLFFCLFSFIISYFNYLPLSLSLSLSFVPFIKRNFLSSFFYHFFELLISCIFTYFFLLFSSVQSDTSIGVPQPVIGPEECDEGRAVGNLFSLIYGMFILFILFFFSFNL